MGARAGTADPMEPVEQPGLRGRRNADAGVSHLQFDAIATPMQADLDTAFERELEGVAEKVQDDLLPHLTIDVDRLRKRRAVHQQGEAGLLNRRAKDAGKLNRRGGEVCRLVARLNPA